MTNLKILEQFEYSPDTGWEHFTGKNPDNTFTRPRFGIG